MSAGQHTYQEITTQTDAWADALGVFQAQQPSIQDAWARVQPRTILVTGCGSTYYLSRIAAALLQKMTGIPARACPASEIVLFPELVLHDPVNTLLLTISRSGTTSETLAAQREFRRRGGQNVWGITCHPESELAQVCDLVLLAEAAQEESIAQTRSFATMLLLSQALAATVGGEEIAPLLTLPALGRQWLAETQEVAEQLGRDNSLQRFFFLGSGLQYAVACEAMLKMKEMSLSYSESFHFLEFRHGPKSMVNAESLVVGLLSPTAWTYEQQLLSEMAALDGRTLALSFSGKGRADWSLALEPHLPDWALPVLYLPPLQLLAYTRAIHNGVDPDHPRNLDAVVHLDLG
jgi:glutamine---fructose-6-phosphate transaminase (isomerizing)